MAFGHSPFESPVEGLMTLALLNGNARFPDPQQHLGEPFSDGFCDLIVDMLRADPRDRPFVGDVMNDIRKLM